MIKKKILILGNDNRSFLACIRSFGRAHFDVHVNWCPNNVSALYSRYIAKIHCTPLPESNSQNNKNWLNELNQIMNAENFDFVIPCIDQVILPLFHNKYELLHKNRYLLPDEQTIKIFFNKEETLSLARELSIPVPKEQSITSTAEISYFTKNYTFPLIFKPVSSFTLGELTHKSSVKKCFTAEDLYLALIDVLPQQKAVIQEHVTGVGVGVEILAMKGKILTHFQHRRIHEPPSGGGSSYRVSEKTEQHLLTAVDKMVRKTNYSGVAMFEFKIDHSKKTWFLIEVNSRFWGSLPLAIAAGANFPLWSYQAWCKGETSFSQSHKIGVYGRNLCSDFSWLLANHRYLKPDPTYKRHSTHKILQELLHIPLGKESFDILQFDDVKPAIHAYMLFSFDLIQRGLDRYRWLFLRVTKHTQLLLLHKKFTQSKNVLYLCKGNICRSPFAEFFSRNLDKKRNYHSAGSYFMSNRISPKNGISAASQFNVSLSEHRSKSLGELSIHEFDLILVFDRENYFTLRRLHPNLIKKTFPLGIMLESNTLEIADPFRGDVSKFVGIYQEISTAIKRLLKNNS